MQAKEGKHSDTSRQCTLSTLNMKQHQCWEAENVAYANRPLPDSSISSWTKQLALKIVSGPYWDKRPIAIDPDHHTTAHSHKVLHCEVSGTYTLLRYSMLLVICNHFFAKHALSYLLPTLMLSTKKFPYPSHNTPPSYKAVTLNPSQEATYKANNFPGSVSRSQHVCM